MSLFNSQGNDNSLADKIPSDKRCHLEDMENLKDCNKIEKTIYNYVPLLIPSIRYANYLKRVFEYLFYTLLFDITMPFVKPLNFFVLYVLFPFGALILIVLDIILRAVSYLSIDTSVKPVRDWGDLSENKYDDIVQRGTFGLGQPFESYADEHDGDFKTFKQIRNFNIDMVETLLFLATTVYERKEEKVTNAINKIQEIQNKGAQVRTKDIEYIKGQLQEAEKTIVKQSNDWGLGFSSISELNSLGGPYAGMFWNREANFIVVAFKGTTAAYFSEWLIDFLVQKIDARAYLYGNVHEGFYTSLFPKNDKESSELYRRSPSMRLIEAIRSKVADITKYNRIVKQDNPVSLWITGHSLGGGLATLFYTRLLKSPEILGENCILRDGIAFAAPIVGDDDFALSFSSRSNEPFETSTTLWRVIAGSDIVPHVAPAKNNPKIQRYLTNVEAINYVHIGEEITFNFDGSKPTSTRPILGTKDYFIFDKMTTWNDMKFAFKGSHNIKQPVKVNENKALYPFENLYPLPIRNHLPHRYFIALEKARHYFEESEEFKLKH
ncbi:6777_t:CDS:2 [Funneliformis geosporum]|uniref:2893_t:CDS:1 n=1 Tax=Funneliformis geosporum TaxID=1117311 RepID=A0A9W4WLR7_9GLOM|nr:6777_t:CDS:2 [Funneliformis geosporum]CAI2170944.1 2893_t:CDS:2 [Funneliformis geosporum]